MTSLSLEQKTQLAAQIVETACRIYAPKDTGNLSLNAIRSVYEGGMWQVVIGGEVAPYAIYTNEEWINRGGRQNPNEHWIEQAIESVRSVIVNIFSGTYSEEEINSFQEKLNMSWEIQREWYAYKVENNKSLKRGEL